MIGLLLALLAGGVFGLGLGIAGMLQPAKVSAFLDLFGNWDPTLGFVMGGAIAVHAGTRWWVLRRQRPLAEPAFHLSFKKAVDRPLVLGAAIFGVGWGLGGYCPGPGVVSLTTLGPSAIAFVAAMVLGMALHAVASRPASPDAAPQPVQPPEPGHDG